MPNLYLTHKCRRGCPFCFARKVLKQAGGDVEELLTIDEVRKLLDHYKPLNPPVLGLLGGEPFLYPHLEELFALFCERGIFAKIFTSATDPLPGALEALSLDEAARLMNFVVNVGTRDTYTEEKFANLDRFFRKFGPISSLSFTIFDLSADATYLFDLIDGYGLSRNIRVGIALPIYNGGNSFIPKEQYKEAGDYFVRVAEQAAQREISLSMDCGFTACMFTTEQLGRLERLGTGVSFLCGAAIDIGPKLQAWNCFPLFQLGRVDALSVGSMEELDQLLMRRNEEELGPRTGIFDECRTCDLMRRGLCQGGCRSFHSTRE